MMAYRRKADKPAPTIDLFLKTVKKLIYLKIPLSLK